MGKGEDGTHTQICLLHQPCPRPPGLPPRLRLQSAGIRRCKDPATAAPPDRPFGESYSTCTSELERSATEGVAHTAETRAQRCAPAPAPGSAREGLSGGAGREGSMPGWGWERGAGVGVVLGTEGSAGPDGTTRRPVLAPPATTPGTAAVPAPGAGSSPGQRRSPGWFRGGPRLPFLKGIAEGCSPQGQPGTLRSGHVQVPAPQLGGACRLRVQDEGGGKGLIWAKPRRVTHGGGTRRGGKRGGGAGPALAETA